MRAILLFAHGAREAGWAKPFEQIRERLRAEGLAVELAFLELMSPTLDKAAATLAARGATHVTIVPLFLAQGGHLTNELPEMVGKLRGRHPDTQFLVTRPLGDAPEVQDAIAAWIRRAAG